MLKQLVLAVLFGLVLSIPLIWSQTGSFSQQGKVTHELKDERFSIAHPSLPLNSKAMIVNTSTGKEVEVTVTRPIPASQNRIADVSSSVWQELGLTPNTDARIYTTISENSQTTALPAARISQTETSLVSLSGNQQPGGNIYIYNYGQSTQSFPSPQAAQSPQDSQSTQTFTVSQADQSFPAPQTAQSIPVPQVVQSAPIPQTAQSIPVPQVVQSAPIPQTAQYAPPPQTVQYAPPPQMVQPAPAPKAVQYAPAPKAVQYTPAPQTAQYATANNLWEQIMKPPAASAQTQTAPVSPAVYTPQQTAKPAAATETRTVTETWTESSWTYVIIDAPTKTPRPSVTVNNRE